MSEVTPFDFVNAASETKIDIIAEAEDPEWMAKQYNPWVVNKAFSQFSDTVLFANEMNRCHELPKRAQFDFYINSLRRRKRRAKWPKKEENDLNMVREYFQCNATVGRQYLRVLSPSKIEQIKQEMQTGGDK